MLPAWMGGRLGKWEQMGTNKYKKWGQKNSTSVQGGQPVAFEQNPLGGLRVDKE